MSVRAANVDFFFLIHLSFVVDRPLCDVCADSWMHSPVDLGLNMENWMNVLYVCNNKSNIMKIILASY